jgi:hypothetical protein
MTKAEATSASPIKAAKIIWRRGYLVAFRKPINRND